MNIPPPPYIIYDLRTSKDFKGITINGYKRSDVIKQFENCIINSKLEDAIRWVVELHSTGLHAQIWDVIQNVYFKYIHLNNPKFFFYLIKREKEYQSILTSYPPKHEVYTKNNQEMRNLYAELTSIAVLTKKNNIFCEKSLPKINNKSYEKEEIKKRMLSPDLDGIHSFIYNTTKSEIKLALNEIFYHLTHKKGTFQSAVYWYIWMEKVDTLLKSPPSTTNAGGNVIFTYKDTEGDVFFDHWTTLLWNILIHMKDSMPKQNYLFIKKMNRMYKHDFKISQIKKKRYYFLIAFQIIKNGVNWKISLMQQEYLILQVNANINKMYQNIIYSVELKLSPESKKHLHDTYLRMFMKLDGREETIQKTQETALDNEDIHCVEYTNYPDSYHTRKPLSSHDGHIPIETRLSRESQNSMISKNMTKKDVADRKIEKEDLKMKAFTNFITYKKKEEDSRLATNSVKSVVDYYKEIDAGADVDAGPGAGADADDDESLKEIIFD